MGTKDVKKVSFNLPAEDIDRLQALAEERNVTVTYALRQAIADSSFLQDSVIGQEHKSLVIEDSEDGSREKVSLHR